MPSYKRKRRTRKAAKSKRGGSQDKCIFIEPGGGLGNQLFVYAAGVVAKLRSNLPLCILPTSGNPHTDKDYRQSLFRQGIPVDKPTVQSRITSANKILNHVKYAHNKYSNKNIPESSNKNLFVSGGFFQNYMGIQTAIPLIRKDSQEIFAAKYPDITVPPNSAFMHVRRGDYGTIALPFEYYQRALGALEEEPNIKDIFVITDDIPWCKEQKWDTKKNMHYSHETKEEDELKDLYRMSLCLGGGILSASTFSAWGAILGPDQNSESTIIYPKGWITGNSSKLDFPSRWKTI